MRTPVWQRTVLVAGALAAVVLIAFELNPWGEPAEPHDFAAYLNYMDSFAARALWHGTVYEGPGPIRIFFAQKKAIADYVLPENLKKNAAVAGCVATTWQGKQVSMICFQTGRPLCAQR